MRESAEQEFRSQTDEDDLNAALHNMNIPIEETPNQEEEVFEEVPRKYTESKGEIENSEQ
ncbi:MAG: hypothetical protein ACOC0N_12440 [Chroococcales cyanobacterium]